MSRVDDLYSYCQQAQKVQERRNFSAFAAGLFGSMEKELNEAYQTDRYDDLVANYKSKGFRVLRNAQGKHRVEMN